MNPNEKQIQPMICPVCGQFYFSHLDDDDILVGLSPNSIQCRHCGWFYDLEQTKDEHLANQANSLCLLDYRREYESKIAANPKYDYWEANEPKPLPHLCPVCGEYRFKDSSEFEVCPVCGWEDDGIEDEGGANGMSVQDARAEFLVKRSVNPSYHWLCENKK